VDDVMLELRQVHAYYGRSHVLYGVDLAAREGEVVSLLGRNGAGKTTTLRAIVGLVDVTGGEILYAGRSLRGLPTHEISRAGIGLVPEDRRIFGDLTVVENLEVGERPGGPWTLERVFALFPKLRELAGRRGASPFRWRDERRDIYCSLQSAMAGHSFNPRRLACRHRLARRD